ncbi:hypothetical protein [Sphingobacterium sp. FBM7-1]|uniref:hypothetical protein n=1 Tax=Sphingobacterium sp. FBM7-1 TaxID=2886688 RepID=UPI001D11E09E|nr:hypothetical protein [Sphingobacterium sp. FBM7-1]MCC2598704.1 hypothetical protein [Sphingobacterium sp. FBM7-1]
MKRILVWCKSVLLVIMIVISTMLVAQEDYIFRRIDANSGLSDNMVKGITIQAEVPTNAV